MHTIILPKGQPVYENLQTSSVHMNNLLQSLEQDGFSGYLKFQINDSDSVIFFSNGKVINPFFQNEETGEIFSGQDAFSSMLDQSNSKDGIINVYRFNTDIVKVLSTMVYSEVLFDNLSTEFINIEKIIAYFSRKNLTGYIELVISNKKQIAVIFFQNGKPVECLFNNLATGDFSFSLNSLKKIINHAQKVGADFNIYKSIIQPPQKKLNAVSSPDRKEITGFLEVSFNIINNVLNKHLGKSIFEQAFTDSCIELTDRYPFMHPFADVFSYRDEHLKIDPEAEIFQVLEAVNECLAHTFREAASTTGNLLPEIKTRIEDAIGKTKGRLINWQVHRHIPLLF